MSETMSSDMVASQQNARDIVLASAGLSSEVLAGLLTQAVATLEGKLGATETKFFTKDGVVISERVVDCHSIQLAAATELIKLASSVAALAGKSNNESQDKRPIAIQINVPPSPSTRRAS